MFKDKTFENILEHMLSTVSDKIDKRQGSVIYDALSPSALEIAQLYIDLEIIYDLSKIDTSVGTYLERCSIPTNLGRKNAVKAIRMVTFKGLTPPIGTKFFTQNCQWVYIGGQKVECELFGEKGNSDLIGDLLTPLTGVAGLESCELGKILVPGKEVEDDEEYRERILEKIRNPMVNSNLSQVKLWCTQVTGVGGVRLFSLKHGPCTVEAVVIDTNKEPASTKILEDMQSFIDPSNEKGEHGLGLGKADIGVIFSTKAAELFPLDFKLKIEIENGFSKEEAEEEVIAKIKEYIKSRAFKDTIYADTIRYAELSSLIISCDSIADHINFTINGKNENIEIPLESVGTFGKIEFEQ